MSETVWIAGDGRSNYPYARAAVVAREPGEDGAVTVQPADGSPAVAIPATAAHRANPLGQRADNCELLYLNEACVLANIAERYEQKAIYTWTSRVLVSVNPYEELKIYGERELGSTPGLGLRELPPHGYSVAEGAYKDRKRQWWFKEGPKYIDRLLNKFQPRVRDYLSPEMMGGTVLSPTECREVVQNASFADWERQLDTGDYKKAAECIAPSDIRAFFRQTTERE